MGAGERTSEVSEFIFGGVLREVVELREQLVLRMRGPVRASAPLGPFTARTARLPLILLPCKQRNLLRAGGTRGGSGAVNEPTQLNGSVHLLPNGKSYKIEKVGE